MINFTSSFQLEMTILVPLILALLLLFNNIDSGLSQGYGRKPRPSRQDKNLQVPYVWNILEYSFPSDSDRRAAIANDNYVQNNGLPIDVQPHYLSAYFEILKIYLNILTLK